jgi:hypothetical protein
MGGDNQRHGHPDRLPEPHLQARGEAGNTLSISSIAHRFIQQAGQDTAVNNPRPSLVVLIGREFGSKCIAVPDKTKFQSDRITFPAPETHALI